MTWPVASRTWSHSPMVGTETPSGSARSVFVERLAVATGHQRQETTKRHQITYIGNRPHVAFEICLQVGREPNVSMFWMSKHFRETSVKQIHFRRFRQAEGQQLQNSG